MLENENIQVKFFALGTENFIKIFQCNNEKVLDKAIKRVFQIEAQMSVFKSGSDIYRLNESAGYSFVEIGRDTLFLLEKALYFSKISNQGFDITIGPLVKLWGIGKKSNYIPTETEIRREKIKVNSHDIILDKDKSKAALREKGQSVDLGGIAKGFAADEVKRILIENGIKHALINLGGNIVTIGNREDGNPWKIGVQNPIMPTGKYIGILSVSEKTIVTSGTNERFFMKNGIRYHHILDPITGYPAKTGLLSVTIIGDNSMEADALTTSLFVLGVEKGMDLLKHTGAEAVFITEKMEIFMTKGIKDKFHLNNVELINKRVVKNDR